MRPQPDHISSMIHKRRKATVRQWESIDQADTWLNDLRLEKEFEESLAATVKGDGVRMSAVFSRDYEDWGESIVTTVSSPL